MATGKNIITETWRDKPYERLFTDRWFEITGLLRNARTAPTIEYVRAAFSAVYNIVDDLVLSTTHMKRMAAKIIPTMTDLQQILYGDPRLPSIRMVSIKYGVHLIRIRNKMELQNGILIVNELSQVITMLRQWALEEGLWLPKPIERKFGMDAISEVLEQ